jgi:hypothetical protein
MTGPIGNTAVANDAVRLRRVGRLTALAAAMLAHTRNGASPDGVIGLAQILVDEDRGAPRSLGEEFIGGSHQLLSCEC